MDDRELLRQKKPELITNTIKVLLVDDCLLLLETLGDILSLKGFQTIKSRDSWLAVELAETQKPDLVLCDLRMPKFNGYDVLIALGKNLVTRDIPVIMLSGDWTDSERRMAKELGAKDCLDKPCNLDELSEAIRKYC